MRPPSLRSSASGFLLVAFVCLAAAYAVFESQKREIETTARRSLGNVAVLKVNQLAQWRKERLADAAVFGERVAMAGIFERWLARGLPDDADGRWMAERIETIRRSHEDDYQSVLLLDRNGRLRLATPGADDVSGKERRLALAAMAGGKLRLGDIGLDDEHRAPAMGMVVPLQVLEGDRRRVTGALYFRIDPASVFGAIESWPVESRTAETLLVRREGADVVFLNRLRHSDAAPLSLRLPLGTPDLPAAAVLHGKSGFFAGRDYRGEPVVSYLLRVPDTDWALVAKMDDAELYAPIHALAWYVSLGLLGLLALASYVFWSMRKRAELAWRGYRTELHNQVLAQRLENVSRFANEAIVLTDEQGRILEVNERAVAVFGYSHAELLHMRVADLRAPECRASADGDREMLKSVGSAVVETIYQRKDGSRFAAEVSARVIGAGEGREGYVQGIIRDIGERKQTEMALRLHEQMTRKMQEGLILVRAADGVIVFANPKMETMFGYAPGELNGRNVSCLNAVTEESPDETASRIMNVLEEFGVWSGEVENVRKDGSLFWCKATASAFEHPDHGKVWLTIQTDISELKRLQVDQQKHLARIRELGRHLVAVQETERRKLGAELHDRTAANLAAAKLLLRDVAALQPAQPGEVLAHKMEDLHAVINDTDATIRDIAINLRPPLLDFLGLCATLKSLAGKFANRTGLAVEVRCRHVPHLEGEVETMLYRIVEEALTHCVKHAGATRIDVQLVFNRGRLQLTVSDDGAGFDSTAAWGAESYGLVTMRDRVEFAEGTLVLESMPGRGTTIRVDMPYLGAAEAAPRLLPAAGAGPRR